MKTHQSTPADFSDLLHAAGLRRTPIRLSVLKILSRSTQPIDAPAILQQLSAVADKVTVYRTLNSLMAKKLIHRVHGDARQWLYAIGTGGSKTTHTHPHFVCDDCGTIECLEQSSIPAQMVRAIQVKKSYQVAYPELTLHGRCSKCAG